MITVEVDISNGLNAVSIVGLGDRAVEEAKDRVSAAIKNSGFISPKQKNQKVVISLAPADVRKEGPSFDLAIAVAYLAASHEIEIDPDHTLFLGELSLEGKVRRVTGVLPILCQAVAQGFTTAYVPHDNIAEASLASDLIIYPVESLFELTSHFEHKVRIQCVRHQRYSPEVAALGNGYPDMSEVRGNEQAKRGLEIAAAGSHNLLMYGPPGTGKTMLAQCFSTILPPLTREEAIEVTGIHSAAKVLTGGLISHPPFRAPHHTASYPAIVGGGSFPRPGEITLAHRGVLFMDEFPEFDRSVMEALRQPLEEHSITVARAKGTVTFPAQTILIASMNPCHCGKPKKSCICRPHEVLQYQRRLSGPIIDRFDIWLHIAKVNYEKLASRTADGEPSEVVRGRVRALRELQLERFRKFKIKKTFNSEIGPSEIQKICTMSRQAKAELMRSAKDMELSGRGFHRVVRLARTIADVSGNSFIKLDNMSEALQYRQKPF